jgi:hypothetical protein
MFFVASAASAAAFTAAPSCAGSLANVWIKASRGSTSVRDGGRARVYVYSFASAAVSARLQCCAETVVVSVDWDWRP